MKTSRGSYRGGPPVAGRPGHEVLPVAEPLAESPMESVLRWLVHER